MSGGGRQHPAAPAAYCSLAGDWVPESFTVDSFEVSVGVDRR